MTSFKKAVMNNNSKSAPFIRKELNGDMMPNPDTSKPCLIVGCGPSLRYAEELGLTFDDGYVVCCHSDSYFSKCDVVVSADISKKDTKEVPSHDERGYPLVYGDDPFRPWNTMPYIRDKIESGEKKIEVVDRHQKGFLIINTGIFGIEYAIFKGFKEIYTIGIDMTAGTAGGGQGRALELVNERLKQYRSKGINVYKYDENSLLEVPVRKFS